MNSYFYCPKEDIYHRYKWKKQYTDEWVKSFQTFANNAKSKNIRIIFGIAPGLDFNFKQFICGKN